MFNFLNSSINKNEILIYVEKFDKDSQYLLFDFVDSNEFLFFDSITSFDYDWSTKPTMIEVLNYTQKSLREGTMYQLSEDVIMQLAERIQIIDDSLIIGFRIELTNNDPMLVKKSKSFNELERQIRNMDDSDNSSLPYINLNFGPIGAVIIRNVGQGNWNEITTNQNTVLIFDCGTIHTTKKSVIVRLVGDRNEKYQTSCPVLVLSHWDVDHYHFLLAFNDNTIKSFTCFIYRAAVPNLTVRKVLGRFRKLNNEALAPIACASPHPKKSSTVLHKIPLTKEETLLLFNSCKNYSKNKSGIGLVLRKKNYGIIFSGDYDYAQISNYILPNVNYACNHYLVVPHHGGNAGKFIYDQSKKNILKEAIISVGKNPYMHPCSENIDYLKAKGFSIIRTDMMNNDHTIKF